MPSLFKSVSSTKILVILGILFVVFNLLIPQFLPKDQALDLRFAYSEEEAIFLLNQLTANQIDDYRFGLLALDMPYLIVYSLLFGGLLFRFWGNNFIIYVPFLAAFADFMENLGIYQILNVTPVIESPWILLASVFSTFKWIFVAIIFTGVFGGILRKVLSGKSAIVDSQEVKI